VTNASVAAPSVREHTKGGVVWTKVICKQVPLFSVQLAVAQGPVVTDGPGGKKGQLPVRPGEVPSPR
jgi:hypothetical protein